MERILGRYAAYIYALVRIVVGLLLLMHGLQKVVGWPMPMPMPGSGMFTAIGLFEIIAGVMIMVGFFASFPAFLASGMLAVGYFMVHQPMGAWPIQNNGEPAVLFCFILLYIAARGSGVWSIDSVIRSGGPATKNGA
jgi:putative oxidoreductase